MDLKRVAVVTGSNKGIGFAIVRAMCKKFDGDVLLTSRMEALGQESVQALQKEGLSPKYHQLDICDHNSIVALRDFLQATYGGLDVLVNNAGISYKMASTAPFSEQASVTMRTNFFGTLDVSRVLFPLLRPHARVVHITGFFCLKALHGCSRELQARFTSQDMTMEELVALMNQFVESAQSGESKNLGFPEASYSMSKVGVTAMAAIHQRELDAEGRKDIVVNASCPGHVATDMSSHKGPLTIDEGAVNPVYCALLPPNVDCPRGKFVREQKVAEFKIDLSC